MILLLRIILIGLIIYLVLRSFLRYNEPGEEIRDNHMQDNKNLKGKKVSKGIGEYIDFEEVNKKE